MHWLWRRQELQQHARAQGEYDKCWHSKVQCQSSRKRGTFISIGQTWEDLSEAFMEEISGQNHEAWLFEGYGKVQKNKEGKKVE